MSDWKETNRLRELQEEVAAEKGIRADTLLSVSEEKLQTFGQSKQKWFGQNVVYCGS